MASKRRLGRSFTKLVDALPPNLAPKRSSVRDGACAPCPRCHKAKSGWPDEWRNDISLPGRQVQYVCADCHQAALPKPDVLKLAIQQWAMELTGKLSIPHELVATQPYQAIELLHSALSVAYEEARLLRINALLVQQVQKEKP